MSQHLPWVREAISKVEAAVHAGEVSLEPWINGKLKIQLLWTYEKETGQVIPRMFNTWSKNTLRALAWNDARFRHPSR